MQRMPSGKEIATGPRAGEYRPSPAMRRIACQALLVGAVLSLTASADAATFNVTTTAESPTSNPIGSCFPGSCTLREAVNDAQASADATDLVRVPPGTYQLPNDALTTITTDITIEGTGGAGVTTITGADTTSNATPAGGVFGVAAGAKLTIRGLTIRGNRVAGTAGTSGGAIAAELAEIVI